MTDQNQVRANLSACIIVKNDEKCLEQCLLSIRPYVEEIVVVDTGSTDGTQEIAKKYADIFEVYTECNDPITGQINDFSMARNRCMEIATKPSYLWADSDDIVAGGENLHRLLESAKKFKEDQKCDTVCFMEPYEYAYDENGKCICLHYRERLILDREMFQWQNEIHEVCCEKPGIHCRFITEDSVVFKHQRQYLNKPIEHGRNLRILQKYIEKHGESNVRQLYYIGLEYFNVGDIENAIKYLTKYVSKSGWADEISMACLKMVDVCLMRADYEEGLKWAFKTIETCEQWGEGYFALGKMFYFLAQKGRANEQRNWEKCAYFCKLGLNLPTTKTLLFINPLERAVEIYRYLNVAQNKIGDVRGALESCQIALLGKPDDGAFLANKKIYEVWLARKGLELPINQLMELGEMSKEEANLIGRVVNKGELATIHKEGWNIPAEYDLNNAPLDITDSQIQSAILMLWKQCLLRNETDKAISILTNSPGDIGKLEGIEKALQKTMKFKGEDNFIPAGDKLDIVFFCGDGVENWTSETVKETGIGGSELMALELAKRLAGKGHKVRLFNSCGFFGEGIYEGVQYLQTRKFKDLNCDVLIVSRRADMLDDQYGVEAKLRLLWVHDVWAINATNRLLLKADRILALTEWHKKNLMAVHNVHQEHVITTRNGIDLTRFSRRDIKRDQFKCINSSSPDRSWPILLNIWPRIKDQVPQATLHLYYGFKNWIYMAQYNNNTDQLALIERLQKQIKELEHLGVVYHDRVNQRELAEEFLGAGVWTHPTWFSETSCITAMECQAAGLRMVSSSIAALNETIADRGVLIDGEWTSQEYQDKFVEATVKALKDPTETDRMNLQQYAKTHFGLDELANDWEEMIYGLLEEMKTNPIVPYQPTAEYRNK